ncbi:MAG: aminomethyl-transferring glycine dehydrogenase subunit GcvPB [Chloroflexota bacterium]|nr:aminomethyl-transferring glycine dehydrogenase subunit GcvPB [Chloroflexota bacterium]
MNEGTHGFVPEPGLIFERSEPGRQGIEFPEVDVPETELPEAHRRHEAPNLPEVSELEMVRHFTRLSQKNFAIDIGFYPLGSCTMKYNPKINDAIANLPGFQDLHPHQDPSTVQGALQLMWELQEWLGEMAGLPGVTLQPSAGAHGELTGALIIRAYHESQGRPRKTILVPDSAHGTNPATAAMVGYNTKEIPTGDDGNVDLDALREAMSEDVAGLMITNPSTLGVFEEHILEVAEIIHGEGGLIYMDGANMNAMVGIARPGDLGMDILHYNLHKTFTVPHGGGGPGAGATAVREELARFLPVPVVAKAEDGSYSFDYDRPHSIGRVRAFYGNFNNMVRGFVYMRVLGQDGLVDMSKTAVLNANYLKEQLRGVYHLPFDRTCKHEVIFTSKWLKEKTSHLEHPVRTLDVAKRLLDYGIHAPTIYFPLTVDECMLIEPTETESKRTLDRFVEVMECIAREAEEEPELVTSAPHNAPLTRLDEARAARQPDLRWHPNGEREGTRE